MPESPARSGFRTLAFAGLAAVFVLGAVEGGLRIWAPRAGLGMNFPEQNRQIDDGALYRPDPDLFWRLRPRAGQEEKTNDYGYRSPRVPAVKPAGEVRVVALGDSCTFGVNVRMRESYPLVAGAVLRARSARAVEVIDAGVPGYTSLQAVRSFVRDLLRFSPDAATLYVGWNDINRAVYLPDRKQNAWRTYARPARALLSRSRLYGALAALILARKDPGPRVGPADYRENLLALDAACRARGIALVLLTVPTPGADFRYNPIVRQVAQERGIAYVDLQADMPRPRDALFGDDGTHPNAAGYRWIGGALADALCRAVPALACAR